VEALLAAASHWGLEQELTENAKDALLRMDPRISVPAMADLLGVRNVMSLLIMEKFFLVHAYHALPPLMEKTKDPDETVQAVALFMLSRIRDTRAVDAVLPAIASPSWRVRAGAVRAVGEMLDRERLGRLIPIRGFLQRVLEGEDPEALKGFLSGETIRDLLSVLSRSGPLDYEVYRRFAGGRSESAMEDGLLDECLALTVGHVGVMLPVVERWIADIEGAMDVGPTVMQRLGDPDPAVRRAAAYSLGQMRFSPSLEALVLRLQDPDRWVRDAAVLAIALFGDEALPSLDLLTEGTDPRLTILAIDALAGMRTEASGIRLRKLLYHPDGNVRRAASRSLPPP
jgi:hypothetical protein